MDNERIIKEFEKIRKEFYDQLKETRLTAQKLITELSQPIPDERFLLLINDLKSDDSQKAENAHHILSALANIDPTEKYDVSAWFDIDNTPPLHADIIRGFTPNRKELKHKIDNHVLNLTKVTSTALVPTSIEKLKNQLTQGAADIIRYGLQGELDRRKIDLTDGSWRISYWNAQNLIPTRLMHPFNQHESDDEYKKDLTTANKYREIYSKKIAEMILSPYQKLDFPLGENILKKQWNLLDGKQYLFVVMPKDEYEEHKKNGRLIIKAVIHKKDDSSITFKDERVYEFKIEEFNPNHHRPIKQTIPNQAPLVWAVHNMTGLGCLSVDSIEKNEKINELLKKWDELNSNLPQ